MTHIGKSLIISGELSSEEDVVIDGLVHGHIHVRGGSLTIGETAQVDADIRGVRVVVAGNLTGSITASARIELQQRAVVRGSLSANLIVMADGARFDGGIDMHQRTIAAGLARHKAEHGGTGAVSTSPVSTSAVSASAVSASAASTSPTRRSAGL